MIKNTDRSKWFGASDTHMLFANTDTATFKKWWAVKLGLIENNYQNEYMITGNALEYKIIDYLNDFSGGSVQIEKGHKPYYHRRLRLRVNVDGIYYYPQINHNPRGVVEIKTTSKKTNRVSKQYWYQAQALMYATGMSNCVIVYYLLSDEDYRNYYLPIDGRRIFDFIIPRDDEWIHKTYLPRLKYFARCLRKRKFPDEV